MGEKIKVAIVEDNVEWLELMKNFLAREKDIEIVGTASDREKGLEMAKTTDIDVLLMDINLSENNCDGIDATLDILQHKKIKIIMLTSLNSQDIITDSFTAGAVNFVSKTNYREIPNAIRATHLEVSPIEVLLQEYTKLKYEEQLRTLTSAEKEIYELLEKGYKRTEIEEKLFKTESTIKNQINKILKKLNVSSCKEAIKKVNSRGLKSKYK